MNSDVFYVIAEYINKEIYFNFITVNKLLYEKGVLENRIVSYNDKFFNFCLNSNVKFAQRVIRKIDKVYLGYTFMNTCYETNLQISKWLLSLGNTFKINIHMCNDTIINKCLIDLGEALYHNNKKNCILKKRMIEWLLSLEKSHGVYIIDFYKLNHTLLYDTLLMIKLNEKEYNLTIICDNLFNKFSSINTVKDIKRVIYNSFTIFYRSIWDYIIELPNVKKYINEFFVLDKELIRFASGTDIKLVKYLLSYEKERIINIHCNDYCNGMFCEAPFTQACENGKIEIAKLLISLERTHGKIDINHGNNTAFRRACMNGNLHIVKWLLSISKIDISEEILNESYTRGQIHIVKYLISKYNMNNNKFIL
jgi:ankyrin repeat protein